MVKHAVKNLAALKTGNLCDLYIREFFTQEYQGHSQLEVITDILSKRKFKERLGMYHRLKARYEMAVSDENYELGRDVERVLEHYRKHIL